MLPIRMLTRAQASLSVVLAILACGVMSPADARPDAGVLAAACACEPRARTLLEELVKIDSGTGDVAGLTALGAILKTELEQVGAKVESVPAVPPAVGDNVVATLAGTGKGHILLIAHMDTVFPHGTVAQRPYRVVGDRGIGPEQETTRRES